MKTNQFKNRIQSEKNRRVSARKRRLKWLNGSKLHEAKKRQDAYKKKYKTETSQ